MCAHFWYISIHHVKYLDKPLKCLEMKAKIKSVRKNNEIFLCIFTYTWKSDIFSHTSILRKNVFWVTLKTKYQNDPNKVKKFHTFQVIKIFQAWGISKYFLTPTKNHTVQLENATSSCLFAFILKHPIVKVMSTAKCWLKHHFANPKKETE